MFWSILDIWYQLLVLVINNRVDWKWALNKVVFEVLEEKTLREYNIQETPSLFSKVGSDDDVDKLEVKEVGDVWLYAVKVFMNLIK